MTSKKRLDELAAKRAPSIKREVVQPVNLMQSLQGQATPNGERVKTTKPFVEKYTTHLRPETIKAIKTLAVQRDQKDYEVVQAALDAYLKAHKAP